MKRIMHLLLPALLLSACNQFEELEDLDAVDYSAEFALPLVNSELTVQDLFENFEDNTVLTIGPDGLLHLQYSGEVLQRTSDDMLEDLQDDLALLGAIPIVRNRQALPLKTPDGLELDRVELKAGKLIYGITNTHTRPITATITLPTMQKDGQPLRIVQQLQAHSGQGQPPRSTNVLNPIDLNGYVITAQNDSVYIEFSAVDDLGQPIAPTATGIGLQDLAFRYAEGYLGNIVYQGIRDTIAIDFFDNWVQGDVYFENPTITFHLENSFGVPTRSIFNTLNVLTVRGEALPLESTFVTSGIDFPYPSLNEVGQVKTQSFVFNRNNSNITELIGAGPTAVDYDVDARTNPDNDPSLRGFVTDTSYYRVRVDVDLPLHGAAANFLARDTFPIDFTTYDNVKSAEFKLITENGIPLSVDVQGYFVDSSGHILDSLLEQQQRLIAAAPVDGNGEVTEAQRTISYAEYDVQRFSHIRRATRLILTADFSTTADGARSVRLENDQSVRFKLGAIVLVEDDE